MRVENICVPGTGVVLVSIITHTPHDSDKDKTEFITDPNQSIQVGVLHRSAGKVVEAHQHLPSQRTVVGTQEVLIITSGMMHVDIYDLNKQFIATRVLRMNDIFIQYHGGHSFHFMTDVRLVEIKQGPYAPSDKVFFDPRCHEQTK